MRIKYYSYQFQYISMFLSVCCVLHIYIFFQKGVPRAIFRKAALRVERQVLVTTIDIVRGGTFSLGARGSVFFT